jgi:hypothetical protein
LQSRVAALENRQTKFDKEDYESRLKNLADRSPRVGEDVLDSSFKPTLEIVFSLLRGLQILQSVHSILEEYSLVPPTSLNNDNGQADEGNLTITDPNRGAGDGEIEQKDVILDSVGDDFKVDENTYSKIHEDLKLLEVSCNNPLSKLPPLLQDLFWGPVTDRKAPVSSGVPQDFVLHQDCIYQRSPRSQYFEIIPGYYVLAYQNLRKECICFQSYRKGQKTYQDVFDARERLGIPQIVQMFQQRIRILEDHYLNALEVNRKILRSRPRFPDIVWPERHVPSLALTLAARSWEDFEIFGSAEKMWEYRRSWDKLGSGKPWPFDMSDEWIGRMRERFNISKDLQQAIKEYRR